MRGRSRDLFGRRENVISRAPLQRLSRPEHLSQGAVHYALYAHTGHAEDLFGFPAGQGASRNGPGRGAQGQAVLLDQADPALGGEAVAGGEEDVVCAPAELGRLEQHARLALEDAVGYLEDDVVGIRGPEVAQYALVNSEQLFEGEHVGGRVAGRGEIEYRPSPTSFVEATVFARRGARYLARGHAQIRAAERPCQGARGGGLAGVHGRSQHQDNLRAGLKALAYGVGRQAEGALVDRPIMFVAHQAHNAQVRRIDHGDVLRSDLAADAADRKEVALLHRPQRHVSFVLVRGVAVAERPHDVIARKQVHREACTDLHPVVSAEVQDLSQHQIPDARWGVHRGYLGHLFQGDGLGGEAILYVWVVH